VKQIASKYRNPAHAPDDLHASMALAKFQQDPELIGFWDRETLNNQAGTRYYRRINVEQSCLACHGLKNQRPQFVKDNYPQDLAYNFRVGDLRGMYSAFIPDVKATLQSAFQISCLSFKFLGRSSRSKGVRDQNMQFRCKTA
jgi:hypothetical protein